MKKIGLAVVLFSVSVSWAASGTPKAKTAKSTKSAKTVEAKAELKKTTELVSLATIYEKGSNHTKPIYSWKWENIFGSTGEKIRRTTYSSLGKTDGLVVEETVFDENGGVKEFHQAQNQTSEHGFIKVSTKDKKVHFSYTMKGETKTDDEDLESNFIIPATLVDYLGKHWDLLTSGKDVDVRLGVIERKETVGFKFFKIDNDQGVDPAKFLMVKMKPTSFIIAQIVDPLIMKFDAQTHKLVEMVGRTPLRHKNGDSWDPLDAEVVYQYNVSAPAKLQ